MIVDKKSKVPIYKQIANYYREQILSGKLLNDFRLPSERVLAKELSISRDTVNKAYIILKDERLISSVKNQYFRIDYASNKKAAKKPHRQLYWDKMINERFQDPKPLFDKIIDDSLNEKYISFAAELYPRDNLPVDIIRKYLKTMSDELTQGEIGYVPTQGLLKLRENICVMLKERNIYVKPNEIQIFTEIVQTLNYLTKLLLNENDYVFIEEPFNKDIEMIMKDAGARIITMKTDEQGIITDYLEPMIIKYKPKMIYTIPTFNLPANTVLPLDRRYDLISISGKYGIPVIEDDTIYNIRYRGDKVPPLKAIDKYNSVIYLDSFSDTFAPGIGISYAIAPKSIINKFEYLFVRDCFQLDSISQLLVARYLEDTIEYNNCEKRIIESFKTKLDIFSSELLKNTNVQLEYQPPEGGLAIWCKLPKGVDSLKLYESCRKKGVLIMPGTVFFPQKKQLGSDYISLSFTFPTIHEIKRGVPILLDCIDELSKF